jgi:hypothetical protein
MVVRSISIVMQNAPEGRVAIVERRGGDREL